MKKAHEMKKALIMRGATHRVMALAVVFLMTVAVGYAGAAEKKSLDDKTKTPSMQRMAKHEEMKTLKKKKVCETLGFDEQGCRKVTSIIDKYDDKQLDMMRSMKDDIKELRAAVKDKKEEVLKDIIGKIEQKHNALKAVRQEEMDELKTVLTVEQQAKYILFTADFHKEVRKMMHESRDRDKRGGKKQDDARDETKGNK